jgi:guanylate kinase
MQRFKIGLDFDDVIAPYVELCVGLCNMEHGTNYTVDQIDRWGCTGNEAIEAVSPYFSDERILHMQRVPDEAVAFVHELSKMADVYFVTAVAPEYMGIRAMQIRTAFPEFPASHIIMGSAKELVQGLDMLLDDGPHNILNSAVAYPVLMRRPWNRNLSGVLSVNSYDEFLTLVEQVKTVILENRKAPERPQVIAVVGPSGARKHELAVALSKEGLGTVVPTNYESCTEEYITRCFYAGHEYRLAKAPVDSLLANGKDVIAVVDICGALALKQNYPTTIVFCRQSRENMIRTTLQKGNTLLPGDTEEMTMRLLSMDQELRNERLADVSVRTEDLGAAVAAVQAML